MKLQESPPIAPDTNNATDDVSDNNAIETLLMSQFTSQWESRLSTELPAAASHHSAIVKWLVGNDRTRYMDLSTAQLNILKNAMDFRYRILRDRYLNTPPDKAYRNLLQRLSGIFLIRNKIQTWIALSRDRARTVVDVLQEVIQELMQQDAYLQQQTAWIGNCTKDGRLRNALMMATTEEYCLRPVRNQPLLMYRFVNYLKRSQRGGMTQVPSNDFIRLVSDEMGMGDESEGAINLLDASAVAEYQEAEAQAQQQEARSAVVSSLVVYLDEKVGPDATQWLRLYLQGNTQEIIAERMDLPIKQIYRLREKVGYHAIKVFALKKQPELMNEWLGI